jgi:cytochrome c553
LGLAVFAALADAGSVRGDELAAALRAQPDLDHGAQLFAVCAACHGGDGSGQLDGTVPRIAGQHATVLIKELVDFRNGQRWDLRMEQVAGRHRLLNSAQDVADIAAFVAALAVALPATSGDGENLGRGAGVYLQLCARCHGAVGLGSAATGTPRLAGQHQAYLLRQMQESAGGGRPNMPASHVTLLNRLDVQDYQGIADYLSRLAPAPGERPLGGSGAN